MRRLMLVAAAALALLVASIAGQAAQARAAAAVPTRAAHDTRHVDGLFKGFDADHRLLVQTRRQLVAIVVPAAFVLPQLAPDTRIRVHVVIQGNQLVLRKLKVRKQREEEREIHGIFKGFDAQHRLLVLVKGRLLAVVVPAGFVLPQLPADARVEVRVTVQGNQLVLRKIEVRAEQREQERELEGVFKGFDAQHRLLVLVHGQTFAIVVPTGFVLPQLPANARVEVRFVVRAGQLVLVKLKVEDDEDDDDDHGGDHHGGGHGDHHGGGDHD